MENIRQTAVHADGEGGIVIQTRQDVSDIVEQNKKEYNSFDERARWSDQLFGNKVASIPMTVIDDPDMAAIAYLRPFQTNELAVTGDNETTQLLAEFTLEVKNEAAHGIIADLTP